MNNNDRNSVTVTGYYRGFAIVATQINSPEDIKPLVDRQIAIVDWMLAKGLKPSWNDETNAKAIGTSVAASTPLTAEVTAICEIHNVEMPKKISKAGNEYWKHSKNENGKWFSCFGKGWKE